MEKFKIGKKEVFFIPIPYSLKKFEVVQDPFLPFTYIMEKDGSGLDIWNVNVPKGEYEIIGRSHELSLELVEEKFGVQFHEYIYELNKGGITVSYSDGSNFWLVVIIKTK